MVSKIASCHNSKDFRALAKQRLPYPIFHYIDGGSDDEATLIQNTEAFEKCDLVPNVLRGVEDIDISVSVMGSRINLPLFFSPTAFKGYSTIKEKELLLRWLKNSEHFLGYLLWLL